MNGRNLIVGKLQIIARRFGPTGLVIIFGRVCFLGMTVSVARGTSTRDFGTFMLALTIAQLMAVPLSVGLAPAGQVVLPQAIARKKNQLAYSFIVLSLLITTLCCLALGTLIFCLSFFDFVVRYIEKSLLISILLLSLPMAFSVLREFVSRALGRKLAAFVPRDIVWCLVLATIFFLWKHVPISLIVVASLALVVVEVFSWAELWIVNVRKLRDQRKKIKLIYYKNWRSRGFAMLSSSLAGNAFERIDTIAVGFFAGVEAAGIYGAASRVAPIVSLCQRFVVPVFSPAAAKQLGLRDFNALASEVRFAVLASAVVAVPSLLITVIFAPQIMSLFGAHFVSGSIFLRLLSMAHLFVALGSVFGAVVLVGRNPHIYSYNIWTALTCSAVALSIFVPIYGAPGASVITFCGIASYNVISFFMAKRILIKS